MPKHENIYTCTYADRQNERKIANINHKRRARGRDHHQALSSVNICVDKSRQRPLLCITKLVKYIHMHRRAQQQQQQHMYNKIKLVVLPNCIVKKSARSTYPEKKKKERGEKQQQNIEQTKYSVQQWRNSIFVDEEIMCAMRHSHCSCTLHNFKYVWNSVEQVLNTERRFTLWAYYRHIHSFIHSEKRCFCIRMHTFIGFVTLFYRVWLCPFCVRFFSSFIELSVCHSSWSSNTYLSFDVKQNKKKKKLSHHNGMN